MTEVISNSGGDKLTSLMKEAETLKQKLEEERQKLNDVTRKGVFNLDCIIKNALNFRFSVFNR